MFGELAGKTGAAYLMSLLGLEKDDERATSPSEACVLCEVTKRPRGALSSRASTSVMSDVREHTPLASDARQIPLRVAPLIDSSSRVVQGRHY